MIPSFNKLSIGFWVRLAAVLFIGATASQLRAQYQITTLGSSVLYEDFNSGWAGTAATLPANGNWTITSSNNLTYRGNGNGNSSNGGIWAYGANNSDRSFGFLGSGTAGVNMTATAEFKNTTGSTITSLVISYLAEEWRRVSGSSSTIVVSYSTSYNGTYTTAGIDWNPADGANTSGSLIESSTLTSSNLAVSIANGTSIFIRWTYLGSTGTREGLAFDDITLTSYGSAVAAALVWSGTSPWGTSTAQFSSNTVTWSNTTNAADTAVFNGTGAAVALADSGVTAGGLQFDSTGYSIGTGTITNGSSGAFTITVTNAADTATLTADLVGSNGLTKLGDGTLVLQGAKSYTGTNTVSVGTLQGDVTALGTHAVAVGGSGTLEVAQATDATYTPDSFSNLGTFKKSGAGILTLNTAVTGSGLTNITGGTLKAGVDNVVAGSVTAASGTTFDLNGHTATLTGLTLTGATVSGASTLTLAGNVTTNADAATSTISGTTLALGSASRTFAVADGAADSDLTISAAITSSSASAYIIKTGSGTLTLAGDNSGLSGGLQIGLQAATPTDGGTVNISSANQLGSTALRLNYGTLNVTSAITTDSTSSVKYGTSIGGRTGSVAVINGADLTLGGTNQFFAGTGTSGEIRLDVNNKTTLLGNFIAISGTASNISGVTIGGTGTLIYGGTGNFGNASGTPLALTLINTVTLQPGSLTYGNVTLNGGGVNIAGTGTVGTMTLASGSNFVQTLGTLTMDIGSTSDQIVGSGDGTFSFSGGTLALSLGSDFSYTGTYTLLTGFASGSVTGLTITGYDTSVYTALLGSDGVLSFTTSAIPEPSTYAAILGTLALAAGAAVRRRGKRVAKVA